MRSIQEIIKDKPWLGWVLFFTTIVIVFLIGLFASSIVERRGETVQLQMVEDLGEWEPRNEVWGENFPREYEGYIKTLDTTFASKYGGSVDHDYLEKYPELVIMWAGYGFSKDYFQGRGHANAVKDIRKTLRTGGVEVSPMPATCWTCKSTDVPRVMDSIGVAEFYSKDWKDLGHEIINPIGCQDCHDPQTMNLRITRPALIEALDRQGKKVEDFSRQEMRSLVCAQCHVEYYFKKEGNYLTFPWDNGYSAEDMEEYYDEIDFVDWTHALSKTPMLKAQHPDYELYKTGVHADRNVSCADCHMPYKTEGGVKFTDHHLQSPLNNVANSCQVCHREDTDALVQDVYERQDKVNELRRLAEKALAAAHIEAKTALDNGATEDQIKPAQDLIRSSQWRWDWAAASNSMGFHSPTEILRVLGTSIQKAEEARRILATILVNQGVRYPVDLPEKWTKESAQKYVDLDMNFLEDDKRKFLETIAKEWDSLATERQGKVKVY